MKNSNLLYIGKLLNEGRIDDLKAKYVDNPNLEPINKLREKQFDVLVSGDPSGNQKYLEWMIKVMVSGYVLSIGAHYILGLVKEFHENQQRLPKKDLYQYSGYNELEKVLKNLQPSNSEMKRIQKGGSHKLYEDEQYIIVAPRTTEASCYYGQGTKWCTSSKRQNQFENYIEDGTLFYVIDKKAKQNVFNPDFSKLAIYVPFSIYEDNLKYLNNHDIEIYDAQDTRVDEDNLWSDFIFNASEETKLKMQDAMVKYVKADWNERSPMKWGDDEDGTDKLPNYTEGLENLIYIKGLLNEGRLEDVKKKYLSKYLYLEMELDPNGDEESFRQYFNNLVDHVSSNDPSGNNKYLDWFFKNWLLNFEFNVSVSNGPVDPEGLLMMVKLFHENLQRINTQSLPLGRLSMEDNKTIEKIKNNPKDINNYTISSLGGVTSHFSELARKKEEEKKAKKDIDVVYEDQHLMVVHPKTRESSCKYGATTQWCTAATQSDNVFDSYSKKGNLYYHIWKIKMPPEKSNFSKIARYIEYGGQYEQEGDFFISNDEQYSENEILEKMFSGRKDQNGDVKFKSVYRPFWESWQNAKIKIDTHYAMNGLHKEPDLSDDEYYGDEDGMDEDDY